MQTGGQSRYRGGFAGAHMSLGLQAEHFQHWLGLWELNNGRHLAPREAEEMNARAHELGRRLFAVTRSRPAFSPMHTQFKPTNPDQD